MSNYDAYGTSNRPDNNCRTCTDFKYWSKQQRQIFHKATPDKSPGSLGHTVSGDGHEREDCPLDKSALGRATWGLLHTMAAFYDENPTDNQKKDMKTFFEVLSRIYPCEYCAKDFRKEPQKLRSLITCLRCLCRSPPLIKLLSKLFRLYQKGKLQINGVQTRLNDVSS